MRNWEGRKENDGKQLAGTSIFVYIVQCKLIY
jgi:hypothetical protein